MGSEDLTRFTKAIRDIVRKLWRGFERPIARAARGRAGGWQKLDAQSKLTLRLEAESIKLSFNVLFKGVLNL